MLFNNIGDLMYSTRLLYMSHRHLVPIFRSRDAIKSAYESIKKKQLTFLSELKPTADESLIMLRDAFRLGKKRVGRYGQY